MDEKEYAQMANKNQYVLNVAELKYVSIINEDQYVLIAMKLKYANMKNAEFCKICKGYQICIHDKQKTRYIEWKLCDESSFCEYDKISLCTLDLLYVNIVKNIVVHNYVKLRDVKRKNTKYEDYCLFCYINLFPEK